MDDPLFVAIRAHGNAAEYIPTLAALMLIVGSHDPATWMLAAIAVATAARFVHAVGVLRAGDMSQPVPLRMIGAITTYIAGLTLSVAAVLVLCSGWADTAASGRNGSTCSAALTS